MPKQLKIASYLYLEVNFEEVYCGCAQLKEIDRFLLKFDFKRVGLIKTNKGWGDAIYVKKNILMAKLYYFLLPIIRVIKLPINIYKFLNRIFQKIE